MHQEWATGIEAETVLVKLSNGEQRTAEYRAKNPLSKVPCLVEDDFCLGESAAILRYLATTNDVPDHWYPSDPRLRARVDSALDWHYGNVRKGGAVLIFNRVLAETLGGRRNKAAGDEAELVLTAALKMLERYWLKDRDFVGGDKICIADLLMVTELDNLHLLAGATEGKSREELLGPFPVVLAWMDRVAGATAPHHRDVSSVLMRSKAARAEEKRRQQSKL